MEYFQQLGAIINNVIAIFSPENPSSENPIQISQRLELEMARILSENSIDSFHASQIQPIQNPIQPIQIQPKPPSKIDTFYTQVITRYGDGFFDLDATKLTGSNYDPDSFDRFIDNIKENIDNNIGSDNFSKFNTTKSNYKTLLESSKDDEEKKIALKLLKNNLLEELGVYNFFSEKCSELKNKTDIKSRTTKYAEYVKYLSLSYEQQDFNEFFRNFIDTSKVENFFKSTEGQIEEEASLISELSVQYIDSIKENSNPSFFSIPLNRAEYIDGQARKNKKAIKFNDNFTISQKKFELTDIIMHSGEGLENGHYYTISKRKIKLNNGREHTVFLQHNDEATKCFIKFGNEVQCRNIKDVENLVDPYEFATLADIKGSKKIEQNFVNIVYQTYIPSSKINEVYQGLKNYGNSCYINSFLAVVAGMNDGREKTSLLAELEKNGIKFSDNKFSSTDENKNMQDLVNALRINRNEVQLALYKAVHLNTRETLPETTIHPSHPLNISENPPETTIHPKCHSSVYDFYKNFNLFSCCGG